MKFFFIIFLLIAVTATAAANHDETACLRLLKESYKKIADIDALPADNTFYLNYSVTSSMSEKAGGGIHTSDIIMYANRNKSYFISRELEVYQDQNTSVSVHPENKVIYLSDYAGNKQKQEAVQHVSFMRDAVIDSSTVTQCKRFTDAGTSFMKIELQLTENSKQKLKTDSVTFIIDINRNFITKIENRYVKSYPVYLVEVAFNEVEYAHKTDTLEKTAPAMVFGPDGALLPEYRNYRIIDTRVKEENSSNGTD